MTDTAEVQHLPSKKRAAFVRIAERRTTLAVRAIRRLGYLGNRSAYESGDLDVHKITTALINEVEAVRVKMTRQAPPAQATFKV